jgi:uncharacterized Zn finger protein
MWYDHDRLGTGTEFRRKGKVSCYQVSICHGQHWAKVHGHPSENHTLSTKLQFPPLCFSHFDLSINSFELGKCDTDATTHQLASNTTEQK